MILSLGFSRNGPKGLKSLVNVEVLVRIVRDRWREDMITAGEQGGQASIGTEERAAGGLFDLAAEVVQVNNVKL
jgi:hypothetical protein